MVLFLHALKPGGVYFIEDLQCGRYFVDGDKTHIMQVSRCHRSLGEKVQSLSAGDVLRHPLRCFILVGCHQGLDRSFDTGTWSQLRPS
jgi:hypothetical protein